MVINISIKSGFGAGLLIGVLLGIAIASMWLQPPPPDPCADAQPKPDDGTKDGVDIALVPDDFKREGRLA